MKSSTLTHVRVYAQSKDGRLLAVASDTGYVTLFDAETGQLVSTFPGKSSVASPPTLHLARLLTLALAPVPSMHSLAPSTAHSSPIRSLTFTSDLLITGSDDKRINVFDIRALTSGYGSNGGSRKGQVASLGGHEGWVVCVEARNERLLASG